MRLARQHGPRKLGWLRRSLVHASLGSCLGRCRRLPQNGAGIAVEHNGETSSEQRGRSNVAWEFRIIRKSCSSPMTLLRMLGLYSPLVVITTCASANTVADADRRVLEVVVERSMCCMHLVQLPFWQSVGQQTLREGAQM